MSLRRFQNCNTLIINHFRNCGVEDELDYPGCKKHWDHEGHPTAINEDRLVQIIAKATPFGGGLGEH